MKKRLKVGVLLDDYQIPAWAYTMLARIEDCDYASINVLIINTAEFASKRSWRTKIRSNWGELSSKLLRKFLFFLQGKLMERIPYYPDAFELKNIRTVLPDCTEIRVKPIQKKVSDYFCDEDVERIRSFHLDVVIRLGFRILRGEVLTSAKYGIWSYHHGDNMVNRGGPAGFWEVMESWPETGSVLQILTEDLDNGKILYRSSSATSDFSVIHNKNAFYWKSLSFLPRKLEELYNSGEKKFLEKVKRENVHPALYSQRLFVSPTNYELAVLLARKVLQKVKNRVFGLMYEEQWGLLFSLKSDLSGSFWRFKKILPPKDRFWADPHILFKEATYYIYAEEYIYAEQKGRIVVIEMNQNGEYREPIPVLEKDYHLSYPFVFRWDDDVYMIPETSANRTIELYKCVEFPHKWQFQMNLMENVFAVDSTLLYHEGKWWLFTNMVENEGAPNNDELFLFFSEQLLTTSWNPHPANPIVSDVTSSRPAGKLFTKNGKLYRPSQNCITRYGYGFNLHEVTRLSETAYKEHTVVRVEPKWEKHLLGTHTLNYEQNLTMIDAQYRRWRWGSR
ncbi:MAG: hypothetical protein GY801_12315 [bacterium]|nr:hypothetical protein [bacterium]